MVESPAIFGHEGAGYVIAIGFGVKVNYKVGDLVLLSFITCGECKACKGGHPAYCHIHPEVNHNAVRISDRSTPARLKDGISVRSQYFGHSSFAKMSVVNEKCVVKCEYPDNLAFYAPIGCGLQTGAGTVLNVLKPNRNDSIVLFSLGSVGLAALMAAKSLDVGTIIALDVVNSKIHMAKELGATHTINSKETHDVVKAIKSITGRGADYAIDCTGVVPVIEAIGPEGTAAVVAVPPPEKAIKTNALTFLLGNKKLIGVIEGDSNPPEFIPQLIAMHQAGKFPIDKLCKLYPIAKFEDAIHDIHEGKV
jgi:Zn-dependent alcohol dehydrogenase